MQRRIGGGADERRGGKGAGQTEHHAEHAAESADRDGLGEELQQDVPLARADRLADADLARPFGDAGQEHVHDADAADDEGNAGERTHHHLEDQDALPRLIDPHLRAA